MIPDSEDAKFWCRCNNNGVHLQSQQEAWEGRPEECAFGHPPPSGPVQDLQGPQPAVRSCVDTPILERVPRLHSRKELTGAMGGSRRRKRAASHSSLVTRIARTAGERQGGIRSLPLCARKPRPVSILETALQGVASKLVSWDLGFAVVVACQSIPELASPRQRWVTEATECNCAAACSNF